MTLYVTFQRAMAAIRPTRSSNGEPCFESRGWTRAPSSPRLRGCGNYGALLFLTDAAVGWLALSAR